MLLNTVVVGAKALYLPHYLSGGVVRMATREELESKSANCTDGAEYAALAMEALQDPKDEDYAKELMEQGEMSSSFPVHYVKLAEVAAILGDKDKAATLLEEAEGMCFEAKEKVDVGFGFAMYLDDKERGRSLIEEAMADTTDASELMSLAGKIQEGLGDEVLANSIFDKLTANCKTVEDYKNLAKGIKDSGDESTAKIIFEKASALADGPEGAVELASGVVEMFDDKEKASALLSAVEGDCMFPGQFVALAGGFQKLLGDKDKAKELLEQGKEFAMSGEENLDLAEGYAALLDDKDTAASLYESALGDFTNKDDILKLAGSVSKHLEDKSIAGAAYSKVEDKLSTIADFNMLAQAVNDDLGDKEAVAAIYDRSAERLTKPADLVVLANEVAKNIDDSDKLSSIYQKALDNSENVVDTGKLLAAFNAASNVDTAIVGSTLNKALSLSEDASQMLDVAKNANTLLADDKTILIEALDKAEENVSTLDEMRQLNKAVKDYTADDEERASRVAEKLEKREASQTRYVEFQNKEKTLKRSNEFIQLASEVVEELDDVAYGAQLLGAAQEKLNEVGSYSQSKTMPLIVAVSNLIKDQDWTVKLLDEAKDNAGTFTLVRELGALATTQLSDKDAGKAWAEGLYGGWQAKLVESDANTYEYLKLAGAIKEDLDDTDKASALIDSASEKATSPFHFAYIAKVVAALGDDDRAAATYQQAADACSTASECGQLVKQLRTDGVDEQLQKEVYAKGESLGSASQKLQWAEGIVGLFADTDWAEKAYSAIESDFADESTAFIFANSKKRYLGERHFW